MGKYTPLLQWLIVVVLISIGIGLLFVTDLISRVNEADVTKLSFLIGGIFLYFTVRIGIGHFRLSNIEKSAKAFLEIQEKVYELCTFVSRILVDLGIVGTVIGFIYMLSVSFGDIDASNTAGLRLALQSMGIGMSTALYTTAAGLICSVLLRIQLYSFMRHIRSKEGRHDKGNVS